VRWRSGTPLRLMPEYKFNPPLTLKDHFVVRSLDDARRFIVDYHQARRPEMQTSVLHRLEGAVDEIGERDGANAFPEWVEMEDLIQW
jgi:DNA primase catalytic subunit